MRLAARLMAIFFTASLLLPALVAGPVAADSADHFTVGVSSSSGTAGDSFDVTVTALDNTDAVDTGYVGTVTFSSTDTGSSTMLPGDYTFTGGDAGIHTFTSGLTLTTAGNQHVTATDTGAPSIHGTSTGVAIDPASAASIDLTGSTGNLASGVGRIYTATLLDQYGNVVTTDSGTVVSFDQTAGSGSVTGQGTDMASSGVASRTLTGHDAGSVSITASASGVSDSNVKTFNVVAGAASQIVLSGSTSSLTAGTTRPLTATIEDAVGNVETADNSTVVTFSKTGGTGTVSGLGTDSASAGVASVTVTGGLTGNIDIEATGASITSNTLSFTVTIGAATHIVLSGTTGSLASGATRILTATIEDAGGNVVTGDSSTDIAFGQTSGAGTVSGEGTDTASSGVASKTLTGLLTGSVTITATASGLSDSNSLTFTVVPGPASQIVLSGSVANLTSGTTRVLTATIEDAAGNVETGDNSTIVTYSKTSGSGTVTGLGTDVASAGVSQLTVTGALVGSLDIEASGASITSNTLTFSVVPGAASQIVLTGSVATLTSGTTRVLTATLKDAAGNVETGDNATIVTFAKTSGAGTVAGLTTDTASAGVAQVTVTGDLVGSITVHATGASLTSNSLTFTVVPGPASQIVLSGSVANLTSGTTRVLTATIEDAAGNVETGDNSTIVTYSKTSGSGTVTGLGTDVASAGVSQLTVTGALVGSLDIEASGASITSNTLTFTVVVGALDHIVLSPSTATVDPSVDQAYTTNAYDAANNLIGDVTATSTNLGIDGGGTCDNVGHTCTAMSSGDHTVTASHLGKTDTATLTINEVAPVAVDDAADSIFEDGPAKVVPVLLNDTDANGDTLTITGKTNGAHGTVVIDGSLLFLSYTPDADWSGSDSFSYTISDGTLTATANVSVVVVPQNDAPTFTLGTDPVVLEDATPVTIPGFAVGSPGPADESAQTLAYTIDTNDSPSLFSVAPAISPAGDLTFTPAADAFGVATLTVHVVDSGPNGGGDVNFSPPQTFHITVTAVNDPPVAVNDGTPVAYQVKQGTPLMVPVGMGVLANDTDVDNLHSALTALLATQASNGTVALNADGSFTYTPTGVFVGADSFTYNANDGTDNSLSAATVFLNVYINHAPTAVGDIVTVVQGSGYVPLDLLTNDNAVNPDPGEILRVTHVSNPPHGSASITGGGTGVSYRPDTNFTGTDLFSYTISDGVFTSTATVLVHVPKDTYKPVATAPVQAVHAQSIGSTTSVVYLSWTGTDKGYGVSKFEVWRSINGHTYTKVKTTTGHSMTFTATMGTNYQFRVRAIDVKGNIGSFAYGPKFSVHLYQETSVSYSVPWTTLNSSVYSGGHDRATTVPGASATFTTTGRTFAWVSAKGSVRSTADVYVDGVLKAHVNLAASSSTYRYVAYSITFAASGSHTIQVLYTGLSTKRVDVDAFVVIR